MPGLLADLEFRNSVVEGDGSETGAKRVGAIAEVADAGARQGPFLKIQATEAGFKVAFACFPRG